MHAVTETIEQTEPLVDRPAIVIVGAGPVGVRAAREASRRLPDVPVVIYGDEAWQPYDRAGLSSFLAGDMNFAALSNPLPDETGNVVQCYNCRITAIDPETKTVLDEFGRRQVYRSLLLATGSRPHVPNIKGVEKSGVFTFRDLNDAQKLIARMAHSRHALVLGGGLLGVEAARAVRRAHTRVTVVEHNSHLMMPQLDNGAANIIQRHLYQQGIDVVLSDGIRSIEGDGKVERVVLHSGKEIVCDTLILSTGIRPNIDLALAAHIAVGRGITVDDNMRTSVDDIYAVGECAEHRGRIYGLVAPGLEQAAVAVHNIAGEQTQYSGSIVAARLKVTRLPVFSVGETQSDQLRNESSVLYQGEPKGASRDIYRKLIFRRFRLIGAVSVGDWAAIPRVQEAVTQKRIIWPLQRLRFCRTGSLWPEQEGNNIAHWPAEAIVCSCTGTNRGVLDQAIAKGCATVEQLAQCTRASTVCGSCKPLLSELVGVPEAAKPLPLKRPLSVLAQLSLVIVVVNSVWPAIPAADSVEAGWHISELWLDGFWKQVSGYFMVALVVLGMPLSARKRVPKFQWGSYGIWRLTHVALAVTALVLLLVHTGLSLGANHNLMLMSNFLLLTLFGGMSTLMVVAEQRLGLMTGKRFRRWSQWAHLLAAWPLPALLITHIVSVYYF